MTVVTSIMTGGMVAGAMTGVVDATAGAETAACAGAGDNFAGTDVQPGIPAAGTGQQTIKFSMAPTRGPAYANGAGAKGKVTEERFRHILNSFYYDLPCLGAARNFYEYKALYLTVQSKEQGLDPSLWDAVVSALESNPDLAPIFWNRAEIKFDGLKRNLTINRAQLTDVVFAERMNDLVPDKFSTSFHGQVLDALLRAFVERIIENPTMRIRTWVSEEFPPAIKDAVNDMLRGKMEDGVIDSAQHDQIVV